MTLYDPVIIITIGYSVVVISVNMILYYFLVILYIICYVIGYDEYDMLCYVMLWLWLWLLVMVYDMLWLCYWC